MKQVIFRREARRDALEAYAWYEEQEPGLGAEFRGELDAAVHRLQRSPESFPVVYRGARRARLKRFPYGVLFREVEDVLVVLAVFHARRSPRAWSRRARPSR
jgi:plasmid stabilization system protein ParE